MSCVRLVIVVLVFGRFFFDELDAPGDDAGGEVASGDALCETFRGTETGWEFKGAGCECHDE